MRKKLYVDGVDLSTYGVYISGQGTFGAGEREYTFFKVPARDGAVVGSQTRLENVNVSYECFIYANFETNIRNLRSFLLSRSGYVRIADDYDTTHFRKGIYQGPFEPTVMKKNDAGNFTLTFNCMPQRWLTSGETAITYLKDDLLAAGINGITIPNPTKFYSKPKIVVFGYGGFQFYGGQKSGNGNVIVLQNSLYSITIDCESGQIYSTGDASAYVSFGYTGLDDPPTIGPNGTTAIRLMNGQDQANLIKVVVTPRTWEV